SSQQHAAAPGTSGRSGWCTSCSSDVCVQHSRVTWHVARKESASEASACVAETAEHCCS
ncbi:unnamed protein product, partial [Scytosiphon promiscuus]